MQPCRVGPWKRATGLRGGRKELIRANPRHGEAEQAIFRHRAEPKGMGGDSALLAGPEVRPLAIVPVLCGITDRQRSERSVILHIPMIRL